MEKSILDFNFFLAYNKDVEKKGEKYGCNIFKTWNCSFYRYYWCIHLFQCCELLGNKLPSFLLQLPLHLAYMVSIGRRLTRYPQALSLGYSIPT